MSKTAFLLLIVLVSLLRAWPQAEEPVCPADPQLESGVDSESGVHAKSGMDPESAQTLFHLLNEARVQAGQPKLEWNDQVAQAALAHTQLMVGNNTLSHKFAGEEKQFDRLARTGLYFNRSGENVGFGSNAEATFQAFTHSSPHLTTILNPNFNVVGIAAVRSGEKLYVTEDFAHLLSPVNDREAADQLATTVEAQREEAGLKPLVREAGDALGDSACDMARQDHASLGLHPPGASHILSFTMTDPESIPTEVRKLSGARDLARYAVGTCFARSKTYPAGVYWVVMAFYPGSRK